MPITFGSVGDIISVCLIVKDLVVALDASTGSTAEYREVIRELWGLDRALLEIDLLSRTCDDTVELKALCETARKAAEDCRRCIESFLKQIRKYEASLGEAGSRNILRHTTMKIRWQISQKEELAKFRAEVNAHSSSISMLLATASVKLLKVNDDRLNARLTSTEANDEAISRGRDTVIVEVRDRIKENNALISAGNAVTTKLMDMIRLDWFRQLGSELKSMMQRIFTTNIATYNAVLSIQSGLPSHLERTLIQDPFILEDAIGRKSPVHMQFISSWDAFDAVLELRFKGMQGHTKVRGKEYILQEHTTRREIRRNRLWEASFLPGQRVDMSLVFENKEEKEASAASNTCPTCQTPSEESQHIEVHCSTCGMWYCRITEVNDVERQPLVQMPPPSSRRTKVQFGQNPFADIKFGPVPPPKISITKADIGKRKLDERDLEDADEPSLFKRVRLISKRDRVRQISGPFSQSFTMVGHALDVKAKQEAEERKARHQFNNLSADLGLEHPDTLSSLNALAFCLRKQRKFALAEGLLRSAYQVQKDILISEDPDSLQRIVSNLMLVLIDQKKTFELQELWKRTTNFFEANLDPRKAEELSQRLKPMHIPNAQETMITVAPLLRDMISVLGPSSSQNQHYTFDSLAEVSIGHWIPANSKGAIRSYFEGEQQTQSMNDSKPLPESQVTNMKGAGVVLIAFLNSQKYPHDFTCHICKTPDTQQIFDGYQALYSHISKEHGYKY